MVNNQLSFEFDYTEEIYKDVVGFEGLYKVSNLGKVLSVRRGKFLKPDTDKDGYKIVSLFKAPKGKKYKLHRLVFYTFNPNADKSLQINHIDNVPHNNNLSNLEAVNHRENSAYRFVSRPTSSKYRGVTIGLKPNTWRAQIQVNKKKKHLGHFNCETAAYFAYLKALKKDNLINKYV